MFGQVIPDEGTIRVDGRPVTLRSPADALHHGIAMVHQELSLVPQISAVKNVMLGRERARLGVIDRADRERRAPQGVGRVGFPRGPPPGGGLPRAPPQQNVEMGPGPSGGAPRVLLSG